MATAQINQKMHDIAEARWKMLPIAVQREHEILAMDISELQWHVKQEKQELIKAEEKLDYASTINKGGFHSYKRGCLVRMVVDSILPHAACGNRAKGPSKRRTPFSLLIYSAGTTGQSIG